jgi:predicted molibdopterin-dependent oxidoreductase YjgC
MNFDDHGVPLAERRRGWRTVLLQAILKGVITEEKANKEFGKPRQDAAFDRYNGLLKAFRDAGSSLG